MPSWPGFPWFQADSVFSTAAVADLYADGDTQIISGGDSTAGIAYGQTYSNGGHIRIISTAGNPFTGNPAGGLVCQYNTNQNIDRSSPAVGQFLSGGAVGIAIGDGSYYSGASDSDTVFAINTGCGLAWSKVLDGITADSPALADVQGNGQLDVVEGTQAGSGGTIYVLNGTNGERGVVRTDQRRGHRLARHRRPHRRRVPGRHRPHDPAGSTSSTAARAPRSPRSAPTTASRARRS